MQRLGPEPKSHWMTESRHCCFIGHHNCLALPCFRPFSIVSPRHLFISFFGFVLPSLSPYTGPNIPLNPGKQAIPTPSLGLAFPPNESAVFCAKDLVPMATTSPSRPLLLVALGVSVTCSDDVIIASVQRALVQQIVPEWLSGTIAHMAPPLPNHWQAPTYDHHAHDDVTLVVEN
jgi:hypothetical protein